MEKSDPVDFGFRQSLSLESFVEFTPYPMWCKDYSADPVMLWVSKSYSEIFGIPRSAYVGHTDFDVWPAHVAEQFVQNDLLAIEKGVYTTTEILNGGTETPWDKVFVTKWAVQTKHFGHDMTLVYGMAAPDDRQQQSRIWHHVRDQRDSPRDTADRD